MRPAQLAELAKLRERRAEIALGTVAGARRRCHQARQRREAALDALHGDQRVLADQRQVLQGGASLTAGRAQDAIGVIRHLQRQVNGRRQQLAEIEAEIAQADLVLNAARQELHRLDKEATRAGAFCQQAMHEEREREGLREEEEQEEVARLIWDKADLWRGRHAG